MKPLNRSALVRPGGELKNHGWQTAKIIMKTRNAVDRLPKGKAFEKPRGVFANDQEIVQWAKPVITDLDPVAEAKAPELQLACFLTASSVVGSDDQRIARMLELPASSTRLWQKGRWNAASTTQERPST